MSELNKQIMIVSHHCTQRFALPFSLDLHALMSEYGSNELQRHRERLKKVLATLICRLWLVGLSSTQT